MRGYSLIKKFNRDFYGELLLKRKNNRLTYKLMDDRRKKFAFLSRLMYRAEYRFTKTKRRPRGLFVKRLFLRKKLFFFYGFNRFKQFKKFLWRARINSRNVDEMFLFFEGRIGVVVFRMGFVSSVALGFDLVIKGVFCVNKEVVLDPNFLVSVGDIVEVFLGYRYVIFRDIFYRYVSRLFFILITKYFEINFFILAGMIYTLPKIVDVPHMFRFFPENYFLEELRYIK